MPRALSTPLADAPENNALQVVVATVWFGTSKEGHRAVPPKKALGVHDVLIRAGKPRRTVAAAHAATRDDDASSGSC